MITPDDYQPTAPRDLLSPAREIAQALLAKPASKLILYGNPGTGKSRIAWMLAHQLSQSWDIEKVNGRNVTVELVREWQRGSNYGSLFGSYKVKWIEEADLIAQVAQDVMLTYLDELPDSASNARTAVIGTSNSDLATLTERFQTRFRLIKVDGPENNALAAWLVRKWKLPKTTAQFIALHSCGNVRAALLDAGQFLTHGKAERRPSKPVIVKDPLRVAAAHKAVATMRKQRGVA